MGERRNEEGGATARPGSEATGRVLGYAELLRRNRELGQTLRGEPLPIRVLGNILAPQLKELLEWSLRSRGVPATVSSGNYDNVLQDVETCGAADLLVVFWEISHASEGLYYRARTLAPDALEALVSQVRSELDLFFERAQKAATVVFNRFSCLALDSSGIEPSPLRRVCEALNDHLEQVRPANTLLVDLEPILARVSIEESIDHRYLRSAQAPYTVDFLRAYAEHVVPHFLALTGRRKKVLVVDADETLWRGILGEDGPEGIAMSPDTAPGRPYAEVQHLLRSLRDRGVLLALCSRNNAAEVDRVLKDHPDSQLGPEDFVAMRVDWSDKATSIRSIAEELNLGLDSFVFLDDSEFELGLVRAALPEVTVLQVPSRRWKYPEFLRAHLDLFFQPHLTQEDSRRTEAYRAEANRSEERDRFGSLEDYLRSLGMRLSLAVDCEAHRTRLAQMTQKTNQFNLTTMRHSESEIGEKLDDPRYLVIDGSLADRFGESGITALAVLRFSADGQEAEIESFLLSCRILGRNLEHRFLAAVLEIARERGAVRILASYRPTSRNRQVDDFYGRHGFERLETNERETRYRLELESYEPMPLDYIGCSIEGVEASRGSYDQGSDG